MFQFEYPLGGVDVGVGAGDENGLGVSKIKGGPPLPKLLTGLPLGVELDEINEDNCSGKRVVVVGGRVCGGRVIVAGVEVTTCPGRVDVPLPPWVPLFPPSPEPVLLVEKGKELAPRDVQLLAMSV